MAINKRMMMGPFKVAMAFARAFTGVFALVFRIIMVIAIAVPILTFWIMAVGITSSPDIALNFDVIMVALKSVVNLSWVLTVILLAVYSFIVWCSDSESR